MCLDIIIFCICFIVLFCIRFRWKSVVRVFVCLVLLPRVLTNKTLEQVL
jgi:hypothetical protein